MRAYQPLNLVFLAFLGAEIAGGGGITCPPSRAHNSQTLPSALLKRFRLAHKMMRLLKRQVPQVNDPHAHMPLRYNYEQFVRFM